MIDAIYEFFYPIIRDATFVGIIAGFLLSIFLFILLKREE